MIDDGQRLAYEGAIVGVARESLKFTAF